jgi:outer membrane protein assembly factor BamC
MIRVLLIGGLLLTLGGCSWFGVSEEQKRLESASSERVEIPEGLDKPEFVDMMPIPEVVDYRGLAGQEFELGLPQALSTTFGVEQIVIRRLGEQRWVFLDLPTATIWPQVVLFFEEKQMPVANLDPRNGVLETEWIMGTGNNPDEIYESLQKGSAWSAQTMANQHKFRVRVEPGVRNGSSELFIEQKQRVFGGLDANAVPVWNDESDDPELEGKLLSVMAYYLGDRMAQGPTVSLLAAGLQESKATLTPESDGLVLRYRLDFDRAWATVGAALENARIEVEDLNRTSADYYVYYNSGHDPDPGFLKRLFTRQSSSSTGDDGYRFKVHLNPEGEHVEVTVGFEGEVALTDTQNVILRERLLKLIKEYST